MDDLSLRIENLCMELLALQQPMARDLRRIIGILKIGIDLERIGGSGGRCARVTAQSQNKIQITKLEYITTHGGDQQKDAHGVNGSTHEQRCRYGRQVTKWDMRSMGCMLKREISF